MNKRNQYSAILSISLLPYIITTTSTLSIVPYRHNNIMNYNHHNTRVFSGKYWKGVSAVEEYLRDNNLPRDYYGNINLKFFEALEHLLDIKTN